MKPDNCLKLRTVGLLALLAAGALAGCSGRDAELDRCIEATKKEPGGRVEPLPEIKPYDTFAYASSSMRSPRRMRVGPVTGMQGAGFLLGLRTRRPAKDVQRELLEQHDILTGTSADPHIVRILAPYVLESQHVEQLRDALSSMPA